MQTIKMFFSKEENKAVFLNYLINSTKGKLFTVRFINKEGLERTMTCRRGVRAFIKGTSKYDVEQSDRQHGLTTVYDFPNKAYRKINLNTTYQFSFANTEYEFVESYLTNESHITTKIGITSKNICYLYPTELYIKPLHNLLLLPSNKYDNTPEVFEVTHARDNYLKLHYAITNNCPNKLFLDSIINIPIPTNQFMPLDLYLAFNNMLNMYLNSHKFVDYSWFVSVKKAINLFLSRYFYYNTIDTIPSHTPDKITYAIFPLNK